MLSIFPALYCITATDGGCRAIAGSYTVGERKVPGYPKNPRARNAGNTDGQLLDGAHAVIWRRRKWKAFVITIFEA